MKQLILFSSFLFCTALSAQFELISGNPFDGAYGSAAFSDVDGDGDQDLLITGYNSSSQQIAKLYSNDGSGLFTLVPGTPFEGVYLSAIAFSDVDGDGDSDVLITGENSLPQKIAKLYLNDGTGGFNLVAGTPFVGVYAGSVIFSDVDGDTDQDVLITGYTALYEHTAKLYSNNGSGGFSLVAGTPFDGVYSSSTAFSDIDSDGDQDVLITGNNSSSQRISKLYFNNGSGGFSLVAGTPFDGVRSGSVAFSDVDDDGDQDVLIAGENSSSQRIAKLYSNDGSGGFSLVTGTPFEGVTGSCITLSDVDNDGDPDVLISGDNSSYEYVTKLYSNDGTGNFNLVTGTPFDDVRYGSNPFADVDGDGDQDVLITGQYSSQNVAKLYRNNLCLSTSGTDVHASCSSFTWIDGVTYVSSNNTATFMLENAAGCDSIVTLDLTIGDNTAPVADNATLSDVTAQCEVTSLIAPSATDNCSGAITGTNDAILPITSQGITTIT